MTRPSMMALALAALVLVCLLAGPAEAASLTIAGGFDFFFSEPGTFFTLPGLPAGFFGDKGGTPSDATSTQVVNGVGNPPIVGPWTFQTFFIPDPTCHVSADQAHQDCVRIPVTIDPNQFSTVVERVGTALLPNIGDSASVGLRMRELHLTSVNPIEVTYGAGPSSFFDVFVDILDLDPPDQPLGLLELTRTSELGGTMVTTLPVCFTVTFEGTNAGDPTAGTTPEQCIVLGGPNSEPSTWRVPEPTSVFVLGLGFAGAVGWTWIRRRPRRDP